MPNTGPVVAQLLPISALHTALLERHSGAKTFPERESYVGASEVGSCMRLVCWRKLHPDHPWEPNQAGRMRSGQVLENEAVQLVRLALGGAVRQTGSAQEEIRTPDAPLRCHPDGRILRTAFAELLASGLPIAVLKKDGSRCYIETLPEGDGTLEIKTGSAWALRRLTKDGLSLAYDGQTQVEMGGQGLRWGLLVMISRDDLSQAEVVYLEADPEEFAGMKERARRVMNIADKIREGILSEDGLPDGEPERGYCDSCPINETCPAILALRAQAPTGPGTIPTEQVPDIEAIVEEYTLLKPEAARFKEISDWLKDRFEELSITKTSLPSGTLIRLVPYKGRVSYDASRLKKEFPAAEVACRKEGDPYNVMKIEEPR
jgi:hypothetical protein